MDRFIYMVTYQTWNDSKVISVFDNEEEAYKEANKLESEKKGSDGYLSYYVERHKLNSKQEECNYCKDGAFTTIIESSYLQYGGNFFGNISLYDESLEEDNSVVFYMQNGHGYIRLGDRGDMNCLNTDKKFEVNKCFSCGRKLGE